MTVFPKKGGDNSNAIVDEDAVRRIRRRGDTGEAGSAIALDFGVSRQTVSDILLRKTWKRICHCGAAAPPQSDAGMPAGGFRPGWHPDDDADRVRYAETLRFVRQSIHQAHHEGPIEACPKNTCDAIAQALGERVRRTA